MELEYVSEDKGNGKDEVVTRDLSVCPLCKADFDPFLDGHYLPCPHCRFYYGHDAAIKYAEMACKIEREDLIAIKMRDAMIFEEMYHIYHDYQGPQFVRAKAYRPEHGICMSIREPGYFGVDLDEVIYVNRKRQTTL